MKPKLSAKELISAGEYTMLPGIYDCLSAKCAELAGFPILYFSGGSFSMACFGKPDMGFWGLGDLTNALIRIRSTVSSHIITDVDNGFGNAAHVANTVKTLEGIGIAGMQLDDDLLPQRTPGRFKEPLEDGLFYPKVEAARNAASDDFIIIVRCMLGKSAGFDIAAERARKAFSLGADFVYFDGLSSDGDLKKITSLCPAEKLIVNLNELTYAAKLPNEVLRSFGFKVGLYPVSAMQAAGKAYDELFGELAATRSTVGATDSMLSSETIMNRMGLAQIVEDYLPLYNKQK